MYIIYNKKLFIRPVIYQKYKCYKSIYKIGKRTCDTTAENNIVFKSNKLDMIGYNFYYHSANKVLISIMLEIHIRENV